MNQNRAHRAFARCLFIFVGPAPVISQRLTLEEFCIVRRRLIHQHQQNFAFDIRTFVIIPVIFRSLDTITDIHNFCVDIGLRLLGLIISHVLIERLQIVSSTFGGN